MLEWVALFYVVGVFVLFFFWIYGIASFALDVKRRVIPAILAYRRARGGRRTDGDRGPDREDEERQLY